MKILVTFVVLSLGLTAFADDKITCNIRNERDAQACMEKFAKTFPVNIDTTNDALVSTKWGPTVSVLSGLGVSETWIQKVKSADFTGAVLSYTYAENTIIYYAIKKGRNVTPEEVFSQNLADLSADLPKKVRRDSSLAKFDNWVLGKDVRNYPDILEDLQEQFEEVWSRQDEDNR